MKRIFTLIFTLATAASALWAQEVEFPHDIFDPLGIPPIPGAKCVGVERFEREKDYNVYFDATPQQITAWFALVEKNGLLTNKIGIQRKELAGKGVNTTVTYQYPMGSTGDKQLWSIRLRCQFIGWSIKRGGREIPYNTWLRFHTLNPLVTELDYPPGILRDFGVTDESAFIPEHTYHFTASVIRSDKYSYDYLPAGTPISGVLEAKFRRGYIPTFAQASRWANALYRACAANAGSIEPLTENGDTPTSHWWKYTYRGVQYQCHVAIDLDLMGSFTLTIRRLHKSEL